MQDQQKTCLVGPIAIIGNGLRVEKSQIFLGHVNWSQHRNVGCQQAFA
jgi:hypothetical protein